MRIFASLRARGFMRLHCAVARISTRCLVCTRIQGIFGAHTLLDHCAAVGVASKCVCERERDRKRVCMCLRLEAIFGARTLLDHCAAVGVASKCVCERERHGESVSVSVSVSVSMSVSVSVFVCVCVRVLVVTRMTASVSCRPLRFSKVSLKYKEI